MKSAYYLILCLFSIILISSCKKDTDDDETGFLIGYVFDEFNNPVYDAKIIAGDSIVYTDQQGSFSVKSLIVGKYLVSVQKARPYYSN